MTRLFLFDDLLAQGDALVADVDTRSGNESANLVLALAAERAATRAVRPFGAAAALEHDASVRQMAQSSPSAAVASEV